jgi:hypothetical protein
VLVALVVLELAQACRLRLAPITQLPLEQAALKKQVVVKETTGIRQLLAPSLLLAAAEEVAAQDQHKQGATAALVVAVDTEAALAAPEILQASLPRKEITAAQVARNPAHMVAAAVAAHLLLVEMDHQLLAVQAALAQPQAFLAVL